MDHFYSHNHTAPHVVEDATSATAAPGGVSSTNKRSADAAGLGSPSPDAKVSLQQFKERSAKKKRKLCMDAAKDKDDDQHRLDMAIKASRNAQSMLRMHQFEYGALKESHDKTVMEKVKEGKEATKLIEAIKEQRLQRLAAAEQPVKDIKEWLVNNDKIVHAKKEELKVAQTQEAAEKASINQDEEQSIKTIMAIEADLEQDYDEAINLINGKAIRKNKTIANVIKDQHKPAVLQLRVQLTKNQIVINNPKKQAQVKEELLLLNADEVAVNTMHLAQLRSSNLFP